MLQHRGCQQAPLWRLKILGCEGIERNLLGQIHFQWLRRATIGTNPLLSSQKVMETSLPQMRLLGIESVIRSLPWASMLISSWSRLQWFLTLFVQHQYLLTLDSLAMKKTLYWRRRKARLITELWKINLLQLLRPFLRKSKHKALLEIQELKQTTGRVPKTMTPPPTPEKAQSAESAALTYKEALLVGR